MQRSSRRCGCHWCRCCRGTLRCHRSPCNREPSHPQQPGHPTVTAGCCWCCCGPSETPSACDETTQPSSLLEVAHCSTEPPPRAATIDDAECALRCPGGHRLRSPTNRSTRLPLLPLLPPLPRYPRQGLGRAAPTVRAPTPAQNQHRTARAWQRLRLGSQRTMPSPLVIQRGSWVFVTRTGIRRKAHYAAWKQQLRDQTRPRYSHA